MNAVTYFYVTPTPGVRGKCSLGPTDLHIEAFFFLVDYLL